MTNETKIRFLRVYRILLSIVIVIAGICLMAGCLSIYNSGDHPYSREIVAETFSGIAFPVYLCLAMTLLGFVLELFVPSAPEKVKPQKAYAFILSRLHSNRDFSLCDEALSKEITALQKNRRMHVYIRTLVLTVASVIFLTYALNGDNYHASDINGSMLKAMGILLPCLLVSFVYALFVSIHNEKSIQKEIELMKQVPAAASKTEETSTLDNDSKIRIARYAVLTLGVLFLVYGFITGGTADVLAKAINICTECVGLG